MSYCRWSSDFGECDVYVYEARDARGGSMKLWLDDIRPAPEGWTHVYTDQEARKLLESGRVSHASLDHDLGACEDCMNSLSAEEWLGRTAYQSMPHCEHVGTGYTLVCWMEETGHWPVNRPDVHSANPVGRSKMLAVIEKRFGNNRMRLMPYEKRKQKEK